jgi:transposase-like protein
MAQGTAARDLKKEAIWRRHMKAQVGSGMSVGAYCRRHGLPGHGFYWWRRELSRRDAQQSPAFVPVTVAAQTPAGAGEGRIEIFLARDRRVRVTGTVDRQMLADVLSVLEDREGPGGRREEERGRRC